MPAVKFLRRRDVEAKVGLKHSTIYDLMKRGLFPRPVEPSPGSVAWIEEEIEAWQRQRIAERDARHMRCHG
jgi:prophage regulatory protein